MRLRGTVCLRRGFLLLVVGVLAGCVHHPVVLIPPAQPYAVLPVDESMSCSALAASFRFSARRAARLEYWLSVGPIAGYGFERFGEDAPRQLVAERRRLDALSDLQRYKGCLVMEPGPAVVEERIRLEQSVRPPPPEVVLNSRG